jgi:hypothetical protein
MGLLGVWRELQTVAIAREAADFVVDELPHTVR